MHRLEHGHIGTEVGAGSHPQPSHQTCAEVADYVTVQVGAHQHVVKLGFLYELHTHVVDDPVFELDVRVVGGHVTCHFQEETVCAFHDIGLVHSRHLPAPVFSSVLKSEPTDAVRGGSRDDLDGFGGVLADHVLHPGVEILSVLTHYHQIDVLIAGLHTRDGHRRPQVRVEVEFFA